MKTIDFKSEQKWFSEEDYKGSGQRWYPELKYKELELKYKELELKYNELLTKYYKLTCVREEKNENN